jgi:surface antigen
VRFTIAAFGWAALAAGHAYAGDIDGASLSEVETLTGAPLLAAMAPVEALTDEAKPLEAPSVRRLSARLQCVPYAREASGLDIYGNASTWWRQAAGRFERAKSPRDGAVMVTRGYHNPRRGHVAVVRQVISERSIIVDHANWLNSGEVTLNVPVIDVSPKGDWSQVRVFHIPTQTWGIRVYTAQGFILPNAKPAGGPVTTVAR